MALRLRRIAHGADDGPANLRIARTPYHRRGRLAALGGVGVQSDVSHVLSRCQKPGKRGILGPVDDQGKTRQSPSNARVMRKLLGNGLLVLASFVVSVLAGRGRRPLAGRPHDPLVAVPLPLPVGHDTAASHLEALPSSSGGEARMVLREKSTAAAAQPQAGTRAVATLVPTRSNANTPRRARRSRRRHVQGLEHGARRQTRAKAPTSAARRANSSSTIRPTASQTAGIPLPARCRTLPDTSGDQRFRLARRAGVLSAPSHAHVRIVFIGASTVVQQPPHAAFVPEFVGVSFACGPRRADSISVSRC